MTREEEIDQATDKFTYPEDAPYFYQGAKWADSTMIKKACVWLDKHLTDYEGNTIGNIPFCNINDIVRDFKKAMEK